MTEDLIFRFVGYDLLSGVLHSVSDSLEALTGVGSRTASTLSSGFNLVGGAAMAAGTAMAASSAAVAGGMVLSAKAAADFQSQLVLLTTHAGATVPQMKELGDYILRVAGQLGFDPTSLAQAAYHVQSVLTSLPQALRTTATDEEVLYRAAQLAAIGHADLEDSVNAVSKAFVVYQKDGYSAQSITAIFNRTIGEGNMRLQELNTAFSTGLLPVAEQAGIKLESVGAALATMTDAGIPASRAATYLRSAIIQMTIPSGPATEALKAIGVAANDAKSQIDTFNQVLVKAGVNQTDVAKMMQKTGSLGDTLVWLKQKMDAAGVSSKDAAALLDRAFGGIRSGTGVVTLYNTLGGLVQKEKDAKDATAEWTATWEKFTQLDPTFAINQLHASWDSLVIVMGYSFLPVLLKIVQTVTPYVQQLGLWIAQHSALVASVAEGFVAFSAIGGAIVFVSGVIGRIIGFLAPIIEFFSELGTQIVLATAYVDEFGVVAGTAGGVIGSALGGPVAIAVVAISALIAIGILLATHWQQVRAVALYVWGVILPYVTMAVNTIRSIVQTEMAFILAIWREHHDQIMVVAQAAWNFIKVWFIGSLIAIAAVIGIAILGISAFVIALIALGAGIFWVATKFMDLIQFIAGFVVKAWAYLSNFFMLLVSVVEHAWSEFARRPEFWIGYVIGLVIGFVIKAAEKIIGFFAWLVSAAGQAWNNFFNAAAYWLPRIPAIVWDFLSRVPGIVGSFLLSAGTQAAIGAYNAVKAITDAFNRLPIVLFDIGRDIVVGLWNGISSLANWIYGRAAGFVAGIVAGMKDALISGSPSMLAAKELGVPIAQGVALGMSMEFPEAQNTMNTLLTSMPNRVPTVSNPSFEGNFTASQQSDIVLTLDGEVLARVVDKQISKWWKKNRIY